MTTHSRPSTNAVKVSGQEVNANGELKADSYGEFPIIEVSVAPEDYASLNIGDVVSGKCHMMRGIYRNVTCMVTTK